MKTENKFNFREAYERLNEIGRRLNEMATGLENDKEREDYTDPEKAEQKALLREQGILEMKIKANTMNLGTVARENADDMNRQMREAIDSGKRFSLTISREALRRREDAAFGGNMSGYADPSASTNPYSLTTGDIVEPLWASTILRTIGMPLLTGLSGNYQWPVVEAFEASINDEGVSLGDTKIPLSKLIARPERVGIAVPITREAITETDGLIQTIATQYIPQSVAALINKITFSTTALKKFKDGKESTESATNLVGPYVNLKAANKLTYSGDAPTLQELISLKSKVLGANIMPEGLCYVMTETTKGLLEGTPKWSGSNSAIVDDNGRINGVPVFTSSYVKEGDVEFGAFKYAPIGLFGDMTIIVDPYSLARKNAIDFVLNTDFAITVLRQEAFALLSKTAA